MKTKSFLLMTLVCFTFIMNAQTMKTHQVNSFTGISIGNGLDVYVTQGNTNSLKVEATNKQHENMKIKNDGDKLKIEYTGKWIKNEPIKVHVTIKNLESLAAAGGSDVYLKGDFKTEKLSIAISGGSDLEAKSIDATTVNLAISGGSDIDIENLIVDKLKLAVSGGSDADIKGNCTKMNVVASGGSDVEAENFEVENCYLTVTGGSDAIVHVSGNLSLVANGASDVTCLGNPANVTKTVSRSSDVEIL